MLEDTRRTCEIYTKALASGEDGRDVVGYLAAQYGVRRPAIYKRLITGGVLPKYRTAIGRPIGRKAAGIRKGRKELIPPPPIPCRDPCPRCGVRRDIGCGHSLTRLGMVL